MKQLQKKLKSGAMDVREDDPFDLFIAATQIRYCYYSETYKILGSTYGMCVLQVRLLTSLLDPTVGLSSACVYIVHVGCISAMHSVCYILVHCILILVRVMYKVQGTSTQPLGSRMGAVHACGNL